jgi:hypothetical protein
MACARYRAMDTHFQQWEMNIEGLKKIAND